MANKILSAEELPGVENWCPPTVGEEGSEPCHPVTAREIEEIQRQAREEGFAQGRAEGLQAGQREIAARVAELEAVLGTLSRPLEELDAEVENELVTLAIAIARQLVRRELKTAPGEVLAVVRNALSALPAAARKVRLRLNPEDAELVREAMSVNEAEQGWQIIEDPVLTRGGCKVETETSQIDATVESRLNAVIAQVLGGERDGDADA